MREEAGEVGEELLQRYFAEVQRVTGRVPILYIREGARSEELCKSMGEEPSISILVLAAGTDKKGPGPNNIYMTGKGVRQLRVPVTLVPGALTREEMSPFIRVVETCTPE